MANQVLDFMHLRAVLYEVLDPDQVLHVADRALELRQNNAMAGYGIVEGGFSELSSFHEDVI